LSIGFTLLALLTGFVQFAKDMVTFGWSYEVTTIIAEVETTKLVNVTYELVGCFFFGWFLIISIQNFHLQGRTVNMSSSSLDEEVNVPDAD